MALSVSELHERRHLLTPGDQLLCGVDDVYRELHVTGYPNILCLLSGYSEQPMPLYIKDDYTARLVDQLARMRGLSKQDAVKMAVQAELDRAANLIPLRDRFAAVRAKHPLPPPTGEQADKAFFDQVTGES